MTPLSWSARHGYTEIAVYLATKAKADLESANKFCWTPLTEASVNGHADTVAALLAAGSNKEAICKDGSTPLIKATMYNRTQCALTLLKAGADISAQDKVLQIVCIVSLHSA